MTFVVGPFNHGRGIRSHALKVDYSSALDMFMGRALCGRRGAVRATWQMHQLRSVYSKLIETPKPCGKCVAVIEKRML